jgi:hypothetical protein
LLKSKWAPLEGSPPCLHQSPIEILRLKAIARARRKPMNQILGDLINDAYKRDPVPTD